VDACRFVIQQHDATAMHYDLRLEVDGVMVSWAVPKGPSLRPRDKRLAMKVGDHSVAYADFEGIALGPRGSGAVIVWDTGVYDDLNDEGIAAALEAGHASFFLRGAKLTGGWALTRVAREGPRQRERWILVKRRDEHADDEHGADVVAARPESVLSGRTLADVADGAGWSARALRAAARSIAAAARSSRR
jgi:DNA ligase D-like protein (predicted 3'-phosphoesterase)